MKKPSFYHPAIAMCLVMAIGAFAQAQPNNVRLVDQNAPGPGEDGLTWQTAFQDLQDALADMDPDAIPIPVNEIWVAAATYHPDEGAPPNPFAVFSMRNGVGIFGGFLGGETARAERDPVNNVTILSGAIPGDPQFFVVVLAENVTLSALLDGFTIRDGEENGARIVQGSATINRCIFTENGATGNPAFGGGISIEGDLQSSPSPRILNCTFTSNVSERGGAVDSRCRGCRTYRRRRIARTATHLVGIGIDPAELDADRWPESDLSIQQPRPRSTRSRAVFIRRSSRESPVRA